MPTKFPTIAIVGSGPSGCYVTQFLNKKWPESQITIFEALPVPYGLVRYGVAADHQGSKAVTQQFERLLEKETIEFRGNVAVGRDVSFVKLTDAYDVVVLATGLNYDATLSIPLAPAARVIGAGALLKALNGHPEANLPVDANGEIRRLGKHIAVIGSGNVAIDALRMIAKTDDALAGSDISDEIRTKIDTAGVSNITLISRSSADEAKCDDSMMAELIALPNVKVSVKGLRETDVGTIAQMLRKAQAADKAETEAQVSLKFIFNEVPQSISYVEGFGTELISHSKNTDSESSRIFDSIITAIGFTNSAESNQIIPQENFEGDSIYRVGWLRRGANGTVAENRKDAKAVTTQIIEDFESGKIKAVKLGLASVVRDLPVNHVTYEGWKRIDHYEQVSAKSSRCRQKVPDLLMMLRIAHGQHAMS